MPELPEMQALAERLDALVHGASLTAAVPLQFAALKTVVPPVDAMFGRAVTGVGRRGKYVLFDFGGPRIAVHLSQGGRVDVEKPAKATRPKGAVVRFAFDNGAAILVKEYGTERKAAWWVLDAGDGGPLDGLGPEPLSDEFATFIRESNDRRQIHGVLRDQRTVAGIGRGYADDILHEARLSPFTPLASLDEDDRQRLVAAVANVLEQALAHERRRTGGLPAKLNERFVIHRHAGTPCPRCATDLRRVSFESHEVVYCPECQTGGKVLADRRLSRLVR